MKNKIFRVNRSGKKAKVAIFVPDKIDFKTKTVRRDKEGHCIMIKGPIQQEYVTIVNIYTLNIGPSKYRKQISKGETESKTIVVGDFKPPFTSIDRSSMQKINN